jgi:hypothetical protein
MLSGAVSRRFVRHARCMCDSSPAARFYSAGRSPRCVGYRSATRSSFLPLFPSRSSDSNSSTVSLRGPAHNSGVVMGWGSGVRCMYTGPAASANVEAGKETPKTSADSTCRPRVAESEERHSTVGDLSDDTQAKSDAVTATTTTTTTSSENANLAVHQAAKNEDAGQPPGTEHAKKNAEAGASPERSATTNDAEGEQAKRSEGKEESWWWRKWHGFKSEGKDFSLFYLPFYPATFVLLYVAFATNVLHKESILDYVLSFMGNYVDRAAMYSRIEAWNAWVNLGFAFVINELLEVVRFPVVVVLYYAMKPYSTYFANWLRAGMRRVRRTKPKSAAKKY